jgi:signal transduction histidine kinase
LWILVLGALREPLRLWLNEESSYDRSALIEWIEESRCTRKTLSALVQEYRDVLVGLHAIPPSPEHGIDEFLPEREFAKEARVIKRTEICEHLQAMGVPPTKMYANQLPLFPKIYKLEVHFPGWPGDVDSPPIPGEEPIAWDSGIPTNPNQYQELEHALSSGARVVLRYQLHAYDKRQRSEQQQRERLWLLGVLAVVATVLSVGWLGLVQHRERTREREKYLALHQANEAQRQREETERNLLEQRFALQAAEQKALELRSQIYASIGVMAGAYAHNIKNLLVRPNDLLQRCLDEAAPGSDQHEHLAEVRRTLGTVTERLQQILRTVQRDPNQTQLAVIDLNALLAGLHGTWKDLAWEKWKMELRLELAESASPLQIRGDVSHLQQAIENLIFNARDSFFEMRGRLREEAKSRHADPAARKQALIAAAGWKGTVILRARQTQGEVILEVVDNGIGMDEEVRRRCTETHFSTKRGNALFEGYQTGMGLGLSFVATIVEHHHANFEVDSRPGAGATIRIRFPRVGEGDHGLKSTTEEKSG